MTRELKSGLHRGLRSLPGHLWVGVVLALLLVCVGSWLGLGRQASVGGPNQQLPIGAWELDPAAWGRIHPRQYRSWQQARGVPLEDIGYGPGRTKWGKSGGRKRTELQLFAGYSLAEGSRTALPEAASMGHPARCHVCHDPATMELRISQPVFLRALASRGVKTPALTQQALRTYVCAQCHSVRILRREDLSFEIPYTAAGILRLAEQGGLTDWRHAVSGTPLLKLRNPEFELWGEGVHGRFGVACPDCHMPYRTEGSVRVTDHRLKSPLLDVFASCTPCHRRGEQELQAQVEAIQDTTVALQRRASEALLNAHRALGEASVPEAQLEPARALLRQAQTRWDFIASEPSTGFHAPQAAAQQLGIALDQARQAELLAQRLRLQ